MTRSRFGGGGGGHVPLLPPLGSGTENQISNLLSCQIRNLISCRMYIVKKKKKKKRNKCV